MTPTTYLNFIDVLYEFDYLRLNLIKYTLISYFN